MTRDEFIKFVGHDAEGIWIAGETVARHLDMHIPPAEQVLAWLQLDDRRSRDPKRYGIFVVLTERFFLRISTIMSDRNDGAQVNVESVPLGRLRSVKTGTTSTGAGSIVLDFAGTVLQDALSQIDGNQIVVSTQKELPSPEVKKFMEALASVRK